MIVPMVSAVFIDIGDVIVIERFLALPTGGRHVPARAVAQGCESLAHPQTPAARATWSEKAIVRSLRNSEPVDEALVERTLARARQNQPSPIVGGSPHRYA